MTLNTLSLEGIIVLLRDMNSTVLNILVYKVSSLVHGSLSMKLFLPLQICSLKRKLEGFWN